MMYLTWPHTLNSHWLHRRDVVTTVVHTGVPIGTERKSNHKQLEHFYYAAIYDLINDSRDHQEKATELQLLRAKIIRQNDTYYKVMMLDIGERDGYGDRQPSLDIPYHE
jgi:hypothetical protein